MDEKEIYRAYREQYRALDARRDDLVRACRTWSQLKELYAELDQAEANYVQARVAVFDTASQKVKDLYGQFQAEQKDVEESLKDLKQIEKVLDRIADAVRVGTALLAAA